MKQLFTILSLAVVFALLATIAIAIIFSFGAGKPSWILAGVLVADSAVLIYIGVALLLGRGHRDGSNPGV